MLRTWIQIMHLLSGEEMDPKTSIVDKLGQDYHGDYDYVCFHFNQHIQLDRFK